MMLGVDCTLRFTLGLRILRVNSPYSAVSCVVTISGYCVLCFHIPSYLQNAPSCGEKRGKAMNLEMELKVI